MLKMINSLIILFVFIGQNVLGQHQSYRTNVDTLKIFHDKLLVNYKLFINENLVEESSMYLYPITKKTPRLWLTRNFTTKKIEMDSIVRHGDSRKYAQNKLIELAEFIDGKEKNMFYYSPTGEKITQQEYVNTYNPKITCGKIDGEYFIYGQKRKKRLW